MAPLLEDPRIRQTWNQISQNAESATESAAAGIWTFQHNYINPCFASISSSCEQCTGQCFPDREERARRMRTRGRAELSFDFYDDWDQDESQGLLGGGWGNDELDRLLAGTGAHTDEPRRKRGMSYGTTRHRKGLDSDPTVIPSTSALGFLGRLPFKLGGTLRYKPSAADLQEHPGQMRRDEEEEEPLIADEDGKGEGAFMKGHTRQRSSTVSSGETSDSFRSRGDLLPSDEEDAVPLPDEFAMALERRATNSNMDDRSSGKTRSSKGKKPAGSRTTSRNISRTAPSSQHRLSMGGRTTSGTSLSQTPDMSSPDVISIPSLTDLQKEEERVRVEEDQEVERKRDAAAKLAAERGLRQEDNTETVSESKGLEPMVENIPPPEATGIDEAQASDEGLAALSEERTNQEPPLKEHEKRVFVPARLPHFT